MLPQRLLLNYECKGNFTKYIVKQFTFLVNKSSFEIEMIILNQKKPINRQKYMVFMISIIIKVIIIVITDVFCTANKLIAYAQVFSAELFTNSSPAPRLGCLAIVQKMHEKK